MKETVGSLRAYFFVVAMIGLVVNYSLNSPDHFSRCVHDVKDVFSNWQKLMQDQGLW
jgi:hypothetical protein